MVAPRYTRTCTLVTDAPVAPVTHPDTRIPCAPGALTGRAAEVRAAVSAVVTSATSGAPEAWVTATEDMSDLRKTLDERAGWDDLADDRADRGRGVGDGGRRAEPQLELGARVRRHERLARVEEAEVPLGEGRLAVQGDDAGRAGHAGDGRRGGGRAADPRTPSHLDGEVIEERAHVGVVNCDAVLVNLEPPGCRGGRLAGGPGVDAGVGRVADLNADDGQVPAETGQLDAQRRTGRERRVARLEDVLAGRANAGRVNRDVRQPVEVSFVGNLHRGAVGGGVRQGAEQGGAGRHRHLEDGQQRRVRAADEPVALGELEGQVG